MKTQTTFAPMLAIPGGLTDVSFYTKAFGAVELRRFTNDDGTLHVVELSINEALFHLHEEVLRTDVVSPGKAGKTTATIGLFVEDVHALFEQAVAAGATIKSPVQDYDYGYRQGEIVDPFGHHWQLQKKI